MRGDLRRMYRRTHPSTHMYSAYDITLCIAHTQTNMYIRHSLVCFYVGASQSFWEAVVGPEPPVVAAAEKPHQMRPFEPKSNR